MICVGESEKGNNVTIMWLLNVNIKAQLGLSSRIVSGRYIINYIIDFDVYLQWEPNLSECSGNGFLVYASPLLIFMSEFNKLSLDAVQEEGFKPLRKVRVSKHVIVLK